MFPELRTQAEMKEQHEIAAGGVTTAKHKAAIRKTIQAIPKNGGHNVDRLIEDRTCSSSSEVAKCQWSVVAVRPQQKYPYSSGKKWGKDPLTTDWLVTIKGQTIDTAERHQAHRGEDPWERKRAICRDRYYPRPRRLLHREDDDYVEEMPYRRHPNAVQPREERRVQPCLTQDNRSHVDDGLQSGILVVGKLMSGEDAEKKLEEIWGGLNKEASPEAAH